MKVPNSVAGQYIRCFDCRERTIVPALESPTDDSLLQQVIKGLVPKFVRKAYVALEPKLEVLAPPFHPPPLFYLLFVSLLLPILVLSKTQDEFQRKLNDYVRSAEVEQKDGDREINLDTLSKTLSQERLPGAHLQRSSQAHWFYGFVSWFGFLTIILLLFDRGQATLLELATVALFTATFGIAALLFLQTLAFASFGAVGVVGPWYLLVVILQIFAIAYIAAFFPGSSFLASLGGFIVGVGICEEFFKAVPIISRSRHMEKTDYHTVCVWGLASGVGFGVAESIFYASKFYNGFAPGGMYLMRYISCVALHAILTASVALIIFKNDRLITSRSWASWGVVLVSALVPSAVLHGLYNALLKHQLTPVAMFVAVISFLWLTLQIELAHGREVQAALERGEDPSEPLEGTPEILDAEGEDTSEEPESNSVVAAIEGEDRQ